MYPRNAASPEPIAIGAVIQITDGAVQTAGVTVRVKPIGVAEADGGGTVAYSTDGVVIYTPTQAETNYTSFVLIAKKTGCIPVSVTVVTSAAGIAAIADAVWDEAMSTHTINGSYGSHVVRSANQNQNTVTINGNNHIAAAVHTVEDNAITAAAIADSAVTEIQSGLATLDNQRFQLSIMAGATSNAASAAELYVFVQGGSTYTVTFAGLDATGNRGTASLVKT
jgi:peptidyl-tRNA hydrolase